MSPAQTTRALQTAGIALSLVYVGLAMLSSLPAAVSEAPLDARTGTGTDITYEVTTAAGKTELLTVDMADSAAVLTLAGDRFGPVQSVKRLEFAPAASEGTSASGGFGLLQMLMLAALIFPVSMFWAAGRIRQREARLERVWRAVTPRLSGNLAEACDAADMSADELESEIAVINQRGWARIELHRSENWFADARLADESITIRHCPHCDEPASIRVRANLVHIPQCPTCLNVYPREQLAHETAEFGERLRAHPLPPSGDAPPALSPFTFALLAAFVPPVAVVLALRASG